MKKIFTVVMALFPLIAWGQMDLNGKPDEEKDWYSWNSAEKVLTMNSMVQWGPTGVSVPAGTTIVLNGNNTIRCTSTDGYPAITCEGDLTIQGSGTLEIQSTGHIIEAANLTIKDGTLSATSNTAEGIYLSGNLTINNACVTVNTPEEEAIYPEGDVTIENNSVVTLTSGKDGIDSAPNVRITDSEVNVTSESYACINGNVTATGSTLVLTANGTDEFDSCFDAASGETYAFTDCTISASAPNGGYIFEPSTDYLRANTALNLPETATLTNTLYQAAEARSDSYYTAVFGSYTLAENLTIAGTQNLLITEGATLTIPAGITLQNDGTLENNGTIVIQAGGAMEGEENGEIIDNNTATGIEAVEGVKVYAKDGSLYVQTPQPMNVLVVTLTGTVVKNETVAGQDAYSLSPGIYIVKVGKQVYKVRN